MKTQMNRIFLLLSLLLAIVTTSCRTEDDLSIDPPADANIEKNSTLALLMSRVAMNDGSRDNVIDGASNLLVQLPITVEVNGLELQINTESDYDLIFESFDISDEDDDVVTISYPISVMLTDFTIVTINSDAELEAITANFDNDDDIECIDFVYPITVSVFIEATETFQTISIDNDNELFDILDILDEFTAVTINFPITVILSDGTEQVVNTVEELENIIVVSDDTCDEEDDNDFNPCGTNTYTPDYFAENILACTDWSIDKLKRDNTNLVDLYEEYSFSFNDDGTLLVTENANTFSGTWEATGTLGDVLVTIDVVGLPDFNDTWYLCKINVHPEDRQVELKIGTDRLRFTSECEPDVVIDDTALVNSLTTGDWYVTYFLDNMDDTADFQDYTFNFATDNTATAADSEETVEGSWLTIPGDYTELGINLNFGNGNPFGPLANEWDVLEVSDDIIRLKYVAPNNQDRFLTFERTPFDGGGEEHPLVAILTDGTWYIPSFVENLVDLTLNLNGYEITFNEDGSLTASNGLQTLNGSWELLNNGNQLALDFGNDNIFFANLNSDWDVLSYTETEVMLQRENDSILGDGYDTLTLQKL